ncbi:hypothetical protein IAE22_33465, partial [Bacillus sp. S34]|nr:hypothetical protein [Bacillus sp. S34]
MANWNRAHMAVRSKELLRDGAHTTITTRFPRDAVRRFTSLPDSAEWISRLKVVGIDHKLVRQVARWELEDQDASPTGENVFSMVRRIGRAKA